MKFLILAFFSLERQGKERLMMLGMCLCRIGSLVCFKVASISDSKDILSKDYKHFIL